MNTTRMVTGFLGFCLLAGANCHAESRVWTSKDGTAKVEGTFHKEAGGKITIILPNGRSQLIDREFLSDADIAWIEENAGAANSPAPGGAPAVKPDARIPQALEGKLIDERGNPVSLGGEGGLPQHYLFYYSASWCGPCHAFTPDLIRFYRKLKGRNPSFEVILVPSDYSAEDELAYMKEFRMPWPGLEFAAKSDRAIPRNSYGYIPALVLTDAAGTVLAASSEAVPREDLLGQIEEILSAKPSKSAAN